jgi:hypothetical protein
LLILKIIKIFKKCYHSVVVMWQHMSSVPVMRTVWSRELDSTQYPLVGLGLLIHEVFCFF